MRNDRNEERPQAGSPIMARRGLIWRMAMTGLAGVAMVGGLALGQSKPAQAQGYPPMPPSPYQPPPPPRPGPAYVWEPGHWRWNGYRYEWRPGHYIPGGPQYRQFVPGHWAMRGGTWVWVPQHWR